MVVAEEIEARRRRLRPPPTCRLNWNGSSSRPSAFSSSVPGSRNGRPSFRATAESAPRTEPRCRLIRGIPSPTAVLAVAPWFRASGMTVTRARYQHLWLSERIAHLATAGVLAGEEKLVDGAGALLRDYSSKYFEFPNRDNVLGPTRLFFSTYLESIWLCNVIAAGHLLREGGALDDSTAEAVGSIAEEAANLIGEFDEGLSNRQTWNNAALVASAVWFEDEDLARHGIEGRTGLIGHLVEGFGEDGLWYEGRTITSSP